MPELKLRKSLSIPSGYFPSLGVLPNRVFPFAITELNRYWLERCSFYRLGDVFAHVESLRDANTMIAVFRVAHALDQWPDPQD